VPVVPLAVADGLRDVVNFILQWQTTRITTTKYKKDKTDKTIKINNIIAASAASYHVRFNTSILVV